MATYNYYKDYPENIHLPNFKPGANWIYVLVDFADQNMQANDVLRVFKVKNHWIVKSSMGRRITASDGNATSDWGTTSGGQQIDNGFDQQAGATTWAVPSVSLDNAPVAITADGYIFFENLTAACTSGQSEFLFEIVVPPTDMDTLTMSVSGE
jgi:hypothetical protein